MKEIKMCLYAKTLQLKKECIKKRLRFLYSKSTLKISKEGKGNEGGTPHTSSTPSTSTSHRDVHNLSTPIEYITPNEVEDEVEDEVPDEVEDEVEDEVPDEVEDEVEAGGEVKDKVIVKEAHWKCIKCGEDFSYARQKVNIQLEIDKPGFYVAFGIK